MEAETLLLITRNTVGPILHPITLHFIIHSVSVFHQVSIHAATVFVKNDCGAQCGDDNEPPTVEIPEVIMRRWPLVACFAYHSLSGAFVCGALASQLPWKLRSTERCYVAY